ncbi:MAG: hypothetical protein JJT89_10395 [Nitriliruptoraceae bacterium]|nr:hypothetical protein [Nitriliruptoraceae bacterium]
MWDTTTHAVLAAVDGMARRADVRANNIANAETPGFRAQQVDFETSLRQAIDRGRPQTAEPVLEAAPTVIDGNGNSVDLQHEMISQLKGGLQRDAMTTAFNFKTGQLRMAISGRR